MITTMSLCCVIKTVSFGADLHYVRSNLIHNSRCVNFPDKEPPPPSAELHGFINTGRRAAEEAALHQGSLASLHGIYHIKHIGKWKAVCKGRTLGHAFTESEAKQAYDEAAHLLGQK